MIPVPSESLSDSKIQQPNAWEIAQEALKKVTPSASSSSAFPRMSYAQSFANPMQQYYSWAPSYGLSLPVLPGYENMYASFYASCSGNRFSPPLPPPPPPPPAPPQAVYRSKNIPTSIASSNEVSRPLRMSFRPVRYMERSYLALEKAEDRDKLEEYFKQKLNPLLISGAYKAVDWQKEPLPSELNFEVKNQWTPASELKKLNSENNSLHDKISRTSRSPPSDIEVHRKKKKQKRPSDLDRSRDRSNYSDIKSTENEKIFKEAHSKKKKKRKITKWIADEQSNSRREERAKRFARDDESAKKIRQSQLRHDDNDSTTTIVGTSTEIEKSYFRLTTAPDPSMIRPLHILEKALKIVQQRYSENRDYRYASDQLRSIRQDLMIQCIRSEFTVKVYETNARIAIEQGDREEFNQCQSQLKLLYKEIPGCLNEYEFTSYRLLYYISVANTIDQTTLLLELTPKARKDECVRFALEIRQAWALSNYIRLFKQYSNAPRMASYIMDLFIEKERKEFLNACLKSALSQKICLSEPKLIEWLATFGIVISENNIIDCRIYSKALDKSFS
ncbi:unnamed protein product [Dracunculus medinensis]|uniref:SAC3_GANP domain-containing protein n=1 Tax=Dracunculus medinensis TaxID=318479 RepID=A0A0N4U216_DRAME|nr:unnamed protein product [Dracunculus medinensis]